MNMQSIQSNQSSEPKRGRQRAFTLIELIIVMVITAGLGAIVALSIRVPVQSYVDTTARAELSDVADTTLRRLARDLRLALPNSIRVSPDGRYLELLLTKTGGRYLAEEDGQGVNGTLNFTATTPSATPNQFTIVGNPPAGPNGRQAIVPGDFIVVYNLGPGFDPADAYNCVGVTPNRICNRATVQSIAGNIVTMTDNPFLNQAPSLPSPTSRFQVVTTPVTYYCDGTASGVALTGNLTRYAGYAIQAAQPLNILAAPLNSNAISQGLLASHVVSCAFTFTSLPNIQRGLVSLMLTLGTPGSSAGTVTLVQQVHVDNAP
jgi:MSHA biogenesis protein MshO